METHRTDAGHNAIPELDRKGFREFGLTTGGIIAALFGLALPWLFGRPFPIWPWIVGGVLVAWALIAPGTLKLIYTPWMKLASLLSKVTTPIVLGIAFFLVLLPVGFLSRLFGRDLMKKRFDSSADSYRIKVKPRDKSHMERPF
jgi:hypothetical protein